MSPISVNPMSSEQTEMTNSALLGGTRKTSTSDTTATKTPARRKPRMNSGVMM